MQTFGRLGRYGQKNRTITSYAKECSNSCVAKATGQQKAIDPVQEEFTRDQPIPVMSLGDLQSMGGPTGEAKTPNSQ